MREIVFHASRFSFESMKIEVVTYQEKFKEAFACLNFAWIEDYFRIEEADRKYLLNPRENILETGGEIFFVLENGEAKGTCALLKIDEKTFELVKMAVAKSARGKGLANHLMQAAIDWARQQNAKKIFLESGTKLTTAIKLYEKFGFKTTQLGAIENSEYSRVDIVMELLLN